MRVILLWAMLAMYGMAALLGVVAALSWNTNAINLLVTSLILASAFTVCLLLAVLIERGQYGLRWLMVLGMVCSVLAMVGWNVLLWGERSFIAGYEEEMAKTSGFFTFACLWSLFVGYCFVFRVRRTWYRILTWSLFACSVWFLVLLEMLVIDPDVIEFIVRTLFVDEDIFFRFTVALVVIFTTGTVALPIIWLIDRSFKATDDAVLGKKFEVAMTCPRCGCQQELPTKVAHCKQCRLEIRIKIDEPRCSCGFLLYRFDGDTCPECGRPVPKELRWATAAE
jgi:hypothetical protein